MRDGGTANNERGTRSRTLHRTAERQCRSGTDASHAPARMHGGATQHQAYDDGHCDLCKKIVPSNRFHRLGLHLEAMTIAGDVGHCCRDHVSVPTGQGQPS